METIKLERDEERAYVLLMTFLNICTAIRKTQEYKKSKVRNSNANVKPVWFIFLLYLSHNKPEETFKFKCLLCCCINSFQSVT